MRRALEIPSKITPEGDDGYFEELSKAVFRAGFSWPVIREKWNNFVRSFEGFHLDRVAAYGPNDLERLFEDRSIVRNRRKIVATVENARTTLELVEQHGSFYAYLRSLDHLDPPQPGQGFDAALCGSGQDVSLRLPPLRQ